MQLITKAAAIATANLGPSLSTDLKIAVGDEIIEWIKTSGVEGMEVFLGRTD